MLSPGPSCASRPQLSNASPSKGPSKAFQPEAQNPKPLDTGQSKVTSPDLTRPHPNGGLYREQYQNDLKLGIDFFLSYPVSYIIQRTDTSLMMLSVPELLSTCLYHP